MTFSSPVQIKASFYQVNPKSWADAKSLVIKNGSYVFRGHLNSSWSLKSNLERVIEQYNGDLENLWRYEKHILEKFKSIAHNYIQLPPTEYEPLEWLALIQDYGGPTRLLDFTDSFYIASFFATETSEYDACVWAISYPKLFKPKLYETNGEFDNSSESEEEMLVKFAQSFINNFREKQDLVLEIRPLRQNERQAVQKGIFLFPCNSTKGFEDNLCATFNYPFHRLDSKNALHVSPKKLNKIYSDYYFHSKDSEFAYPEVVKIILRRSWQREIALDLNLMNIDSTSLFPSLDGFARSLRYIIRSDPTTH